MISFFLVSIVLVLTHKLPWIEQNLMRGPGPAMGLEQSMGGPFLVWKTQGKNQTKISAIPVVKL